MVQRRNGSQEVGFVKPVTCVTDCLNSGADCCAKRRSVLAGLRLSGDTNSLIARWSGLFVWPASIEECHNENLITLCVMSD